MDIAYIGILIPFVGMSIPIFAIWTRHRQKLAEMQINAAPDERAGSALQYASQVKELEDRVRVLERIVTDQGYGVAHQIEQLRDKQAN